MDFSVKLNWMNVSVTHAALLEQIVALIWIILLFVTVARVIPDQRVRSISMTVHPILV